MVEPNADFNQLMRSPAQELFGLNYFSDAAPLYEGDEIEVTVANGTIYSSQWLALYESPGFTGPLTTGGDYYNFFVLNLAPASYNESAKEYFARNSTLLNTTMPVPSQKLKNLTSWYTLNEAYPAETIMHQENLGLYSSGDLTGYHLEDISTAVLSLPSFEQYGGGVLYFSAAINEFSDKARDRNASKIIIDLQQNKGGSLGLALYTFTKASQMKITASW
jgi:hypothetical protein